MNNIIQVIRVSYKKWIYTLASCNYSSCFWNHQQNYIIIIKQYSKLILGLDTINMLLPNSFHNQKTQKYTFTCSKASTSPMLSHPCLICSEQWNSKEFIPPTTPLRCTGFLLKTTSFIALHIHHIVTRQIIWKAFAFHFEILVNSYISNKPITSTNGIIIWYLTPIS